jgi:hypothetical protein
MLEMIELLLRWITSLLKSRRCAPAQNVQLMTEDDILSLQSTLRLQKRRHPAQQQFDHFQHPAG